MSILVIGKDSWISRNLLPLGIHYDQSTSVISGRSLLKLLSENGRSALESEISKFGPSSIINVYGVKSGTIEELEFANTTFPELLASYALEIGSKFIHIGSASEYGAKSRSYRINEREEPSGHFTDYGRTKLLGTERIISVNSEALILRIFNLYGHGAPKSNLIESLSDSLRKDFHCGSTEVTIQNVETTRDFLHISEVSRLLRLLIDSEAVGIMNVCSGIPTKLGDLVNEVLKLSKQSQDRTLISLRTTKDTIIGDPSRLLGCLGISETDSYPSLSKYLLNKICD